MLDRRRARAGLVAASVAGAIALLVIVVLFTSASNPYTLDISAHLPRAVQAGTIVEVRVAASWSGPAPISTSLRLDGIADVTPLQFGPDGYESREYCDEDNGDPIAERSRTSITWSTGGLWSGASCEVRLFFTPLQPGRYVARIHFLSDRTYSALVAPYPYARGREMDLPLTVLPSR